MVIKMGTTPKENGKALESLKVFGLVRTGNEIEKSVDSIEETKLTFTLGAEIVLPKTVTAVMNDNTKSSVSVVWNSVDLESIKNGKAETHKIFGTAEGKEAICYISMIEYNYLKNPDFEEGDIFWTSKKLSEFEQLALEEKISDSLSGTKHYHFWGSAENTVEFTLEQSLGLIEAGKYNFSLSIMGGDGGKTEIYAYVKVDGEIVEKAESFITVYNEWHTATISDFEYDGEKDFTVGIYVKCQGPNAWGKIDGGILNRVS